MTKKRSRTRRHRAYKKTKRGGSFKSVLGSIGNTLLSVAPLVLSALGRRRRIRGGVRGRGEYPVA